MTPVLGDPNVTAFLKALSLHRPVLFNLYSNDLLVFDFITNFNNKC